MGRKLIIAAALMLATAGPAGAISIDTALRAWKAGGELALIVDAEAKDYMWAVIIHCPGSEVKLGSWASLLAEFQDSVRKRREQRANNGEDDIASELVWWAQQHGCDHINTVDR